MSRFKVGDIVEVTTWGYDGTLRHFFNKGDVGKVLVNDIRNIDSNMYTVAVGDKSQIMHENDLSEFGSNIYTRPDVIEFLKISASLANEELKSWGYEDSAQTASDLEDAYFDLPKYIREELLK